MTPLETLLGRHGDSPTLEDFGGEDQIWTQANELATSRLWFRAAETLLAAWDRLSSPDRAAAFIAEALTTENRPGVVGDLLDRLCDHSGYLEHHAATLNRIALRRTGSHATALEAETAGLFLEAALRLALAGGAIKRYGLLDILVDPQVVSAPIGYARQVVRALGAAYEQWRDEDLTTALHAFIDIPTLRSDAAFELAMCYLSDAFNAADRPSLLTQLTTSRTHFSEAIGSDEDRPDATAYRAAINAVLAFEAGDNEALAAEATQLRRSTSEHRLWLTGLRTGWRDGRYDTEAAWYTLSTDLERAATHLNAPLPTWPSQTIQHILAVYTAHRSVRLTSTGTASALQLLVAPRIEDAFAAREGLLLHVRGLLADAPPDWDRHAAEELRSVVESRLGLQPEEAAEDGPGKDGAAGDLAAALGRQVLVGLGQVRSVMACLLDRLCRWSGVLGGELAAVRCDLEDFAAEMFEPFARADQRRWGEVYLRGLLLDGGRKSVEPMAARLGEDGNRQALAHFVTSSPWDAAHVRARLAWRMQPVVKPTALIIDDTGFLKDGDASACVTRQYTGTAGKVTNCQAGVSLHLASNGASAAVNWRLFLPESWDPASPKADPVKVVRRDKCAIPAQVGHVEKWQLALDMIDETRSWGIEVPQVIADAGYGDTAAFRLGLEERGLDYVVGISTTTTAQPEDAQPCTPAYSGLGRRPVPAYPDPAQRVKSLVIAAGKSSARPVQWREGSRPGSGRSGHKRMYSRFVALRIRPAGREIRKATAATELPTRWLLAEWPTGQDEPVQFWLSNLPETTPLPVLVRTAKLRWRIENDYREMKQALGLAHFEGRTWPGWHHHVTLVSVAHAFCTLQRLSRSPKETASA